MCRVLHIPRRPTCVNPMEEFGRISQKPTTLFSAMARTCGRDSLTTRSMNARDCSAENPSTVARYHFSAATELTASRADSISDSRPGRISTIRSFRISKYCALKSYSQAWQPSEGEYLGLQRTDSKRSAALCGLHNAISEERSPCWSPLWIDWQLKPRNL